MAKVTTDAETIDIRRKSHGGKPATVSRTREGGVGIVRTMFPDSPQTDHHALTEIPWEEFFDQFESSDLTLIYEQDSLFNQCPASAFMRQIGVNETWRCGHRAESLP